MAKPTRFPFGIALGFENQFNNYGKGGVSLFNSTTQYEQTTAGLLAQMSTAPDVSFGSLFYTNNTGNTTITDFKTTWIGRSATNLASGQVDTSGPVPEGKLIHVIFLDNSTQLANAGNLILQTTDNLIGANHSITLLGSNGKWYEITRSRNSTSDVSTYTVGSATTSFNVSDVRMGIVTATNASTQIQSLSGGQIGQFFTLQATNTNGISLYVNTAGNIVLPGTNQWLIATSAAYLFQKLSDLKWHMFITNTAGGII